MTDTISKSKRSWVMSRIGSENTKPEKRVRSLLYAMGYRFRLHRKDLPGKPDITLAKHKTAIFVHGCFWHRHENCSKNRLPKSNIDFWREKFDKNVARDAENIRELRGLGWRVEVIWECETSDLDALKQRLSEIFEPMSIVYKANVADIEKTPIAAEPENKEFYENRDN
ncbi:MAG: DNA mismatch endonuclease Vsr [Kiritimatiellaeota bacterium]|nr:DNA mismatch endonuclease Vsr [Kiritimatiellota bacterium]